ncbi:MAG TPA: hypothetical protein VHO50_06355 [Bacteroidales bacterium]|nr:hypothetical protein [Bacteroidales bacterium]
MEEVRNNSAQNIGIAALITAIITFVFAVIPCVGLIAIIPGIITIILASVGLSQASRNNSPKGIIIAALVIGIIASLISFSQIFIAGKIATNAGKWPNELQNIIEDVQDNVIKEMDDANVNIKIETDDETIEVNATKKNKVDLLEELEGTDSLSRDTTRNRE